MPELTTVNFAEFPLLPPAKSDKNHVPIMCTLECTPTVIPATDNESVCCFRKANFEAIGEYLQSMNLNDIISFAPNVNAATSALYDVLNSAIDHFVPKSTIRSSQRPKWHDNGKRVNNSIPSTIKYGDRTASTDKEKANLFADFFQSLDFFQSFVYETDGRSNK